MEELCNKVLLNFGRKILKISKEPKKYLITELICAHLQLKENGRKNLRINKNNKKFVYLISPNKIKNKDFLGSLNIIDVLRPKFKCTLL